MFRSTFALIAAALASRGADTFYVGAPRPVPGVPFISMAPALRSGRGKVRHGWSGKRHEHRPPKAYSARKKAARKARRRRLRAA